MFHLVIRAEFLCTLLFTELSTLSYITFLKKKKKLIRILICCHTMILYISKYNLKIPYSQVSCISYNYKEGKEVPKSSESVLADNIKVELLWRASHADPLRTQTKLCLREP